MGRREGLTLRQKALDGLERSTRMLGVAAALRAEGKYLEAARVRTDAQTQRRISTLLMAQAHNIELNQVNAVRFTSTPPDTWREAESSAHHSR